MWLSRTRMLFGSEALERLKKARVAVLGIGGVGGYVVEVLARSGVGELHLFDNDVVAETNLNRQIVALRSTLGKYKTDVSASRVADINPSCCIKTFHLFYTPQNADQIDLSQYDYVADCVDTVAAKAELIRRCTSLGVPIISSMGAGAKTDATAFRVGDLSKTKVDPLAKALRRKLAAEGIRHAKCVWSEEQPVPLHPETFVNCETKHSGRPVPASNAFVPATAGLIIGGEIVKDLIGNTVKR